MPDWIVQTPVSTVRPTPPKAAPAASGGSSVYGSYDTITPTSGQKSITLFGSGFSITLAVRSTVALSTSVTGVGAAGGTGYVAAALVDVGSSASQTRQANAASSTGSLTVQYLSMTAAGVVTLDAGTYLVRPGVEFNTTAIAPFSVNFYCVSTAIVGTNTEANNMTYGP